MGLAPAQRHLSLFSDAVIEEHSPAGPRTSCTVSESYRWKRVGFMLADCAGSRSVWKEPNYEMLPANTLSSTQPLVLCPAGQELSAECSALAHSQVWMCCLLPCVGCH